MILQGVYRSKRTIELYEDHNSGRLTKDAFSFFLFDKDKNVKMYVSSNPEPVNPEHRYWNGSTGELIQLGNGSCVAELFSVLTQQTSIFHFRELENGELEALESDSSVSSVFEKVLDIE